MTVTMRCQNCGFTFVVTYHATVATPGKAGAITCGHCRSTQWSSQSN